MTHRVVFSAHCLDCPNERPREFTDYEDRSNWVGSHRVSTGHRVTMWLGPPRE